MANTLLTPTAVTREAVRVLHNQLSFVKSINRHYDSSFAVEGAKIGDSLKIRLPNRYTVRETQTMDVQDVTETSVTLRTNNWLGTDMSFSDKDLLLDIDDFSNRIIKPAVSKLASMLDLRALAMVKDIYNQAGTAGTTPASLLVALQVAQKLNEFAAPVDDDRTLVVDPAAHVGMVNALSGLFQSSQQIKDQYEKGLMGIGAGFTWKMDQNIPKHTTGAFAGTVLVNDTVASGDAVISMDAFTDSAPTAKKGDIFTLASVNAVNPETGEDTGSLQQFVVTADITGSSNAITDIAISPSIISSGATKTVTALPANDAAVTWVGTASTVYPLNIGFHKDAFTLVTADLPLPKGVQFAGRAQMDGISMRVLKDFDIVNSVERSRIDILYGIKTIRPELACRLIG